MNVNTKTERDDTPRLVDVRDYGAVRDGVTGDSAAFRGALDESLQIDRDDSAMIIDLMQRKQLIPPGRYFIGTQIDLVKIGLLPKREA